MNSWLNIPACTALGGLCGAAALRWAGRLLRARGRSDTLSRTGQALLVLGGAAAGGIIGWITGGWLPALLSLALLAVCLTVGITDWLCRLIPNPTVLAVLGLGGVTLICFLLRLPGLPPFRLGASLGGLAGGLILFSLPALLGKQVGAGDVKLAGAMGFLLGFDGALLAVIAMGLLMLTYSMAQRKMPLLTFLKTDIPMGPFIAAGMMGAWLLPYLPVTGG